jgi:zinc protease
MKRASAILFLVVLVLGSVAIAQQGDKSVSAKAVQRLNRAPVNKAVLQVKLPRPVEKQLPNGLTVLVIPQHKLPTINVEMWVKAGALSDPKDLPGLAKFTAEMLKEGTAKRTSSQMASEADEIGAHISADANFGYGTTSVVAAGLVDTVDRMFELVSDMVLNPVFPTQELDKYKARLLPELEQQRSEPDFLGREKLHQVVYGDFPAAVVSATPESVKKVTSDDLKKFHANYYAPNNAVIAIVGDIEPAQAFVLVNKYFGVWKKHPVEEAKLDEVPAPSAAKISLIDRPGSVQTNILAGEYSVRRADPDYIPLRVMNRILGEGAAARLFLDLREEKGYTYWAYSNFTAHNYRGVFLANTEVRNAVTDPALRDLLAEFGRIRDEKVSESELDEARRAIIARFALSLESPNILLNAWLTVNYYHLPATYWDQYPAEVAKVTPDDVQRVARKYLDKDHLQVVCVGDAKQIGSALGKYGILDVFDADGRAIKLQQAAGPGQ